MLFQDLKLKTGSGLITVTSFMSVLKPFALPSDSDAVSAQ
jgi:hypothetical protein